MAFRRLLSKHSPIITSTSLSSTQPLNAAKCTPHREYLSSPESAEKGFFRRFLHRGIPEFISLPFSDKLRERLNGGDRLHLDGVLSPPPSRADRGVEGYGVSVEDARKLLWMAQVEKLKGRVRELGKASVSYWDFVMICRDCCGVGETQAVEFVDSLDRSGHVIVLGHVVFLRPDQVAKSMESLISQALATPNDPRRKQLARLEKEKSVIDKKARTQVRRELYCGLGFLLVQTLGFMRLTFWELSWDVMEPICFFVASLHFALAYGFFLSTSTEPSFEGYFYRRFKAKQKKLMKAHNFDIEQYNELRKAFYPNLGYWNPFSEEHFTPFFYREEGAALAPSTMTKNFQC